MTTSHIIIYSFFIYPLTHSINTYQMPVFAKHLTRYKKNKNDKKLVRFSPMTIAASGSIVIMI